MSETAWVSHKCPVCAGTGTVNATNASGDLIPPFDRGQTHCEGCERTAVDALDERDALLRNFGRVAALLINEQKHHTVTTSIVSSGYLVALGKFANDAANLLLDSPARAQP